MYEATLTLTFAHKVHMRNEILRISVLPCVNHIRLKEGQQSDLLNTEAVGYSSARLVNSFHSGMSAPIDSSLCRLPPSLKKKLVCGYSLDNVCLIQRGLHHEPVLLTSTRYLGLK